MFSCRYCLTSTQTLLVKFIKVVRFISRCLTGIITNAFVHINSALTCWRRNGVILDHLRLASLNGLHLLQDALLPRPLFFVGGQHQRGVLRSRDGAQSRANRFGSHRCSQWFCSHLRPNQTDCHVTTPISLTAADIV